MEAEADGCDVEVVERWAGNGGGGLVVWNAEIALVGEHLVTSEALGEKV